ncbi:ABC transporter ATP-binding protein [Mycoplasma flocculare]|uniref:ABC transporter ATP-binding protein n=1 Tax=Mesomycoplasma flocculare TaxID=2128 RepID=A0AAW9XDT9_MESFC|nr:ABC transporter ATP-binding protein [Mesomycoplasma flocculare]MXR39491.1 ABC transporter ATP-binding protein [Mycoplasma sp. MF12]MXR05900.1 ABC transporter ATP-binding protein [Mesomycoplasma flocculare]MXR12312.1 ABC transporter ATP-binding protein [Mesomycoplasma flocculare]MXR56087.1 ABC transporter ATP-binding protein [Mesomycoplasma flocculare]MXR56726.1 ABC transporter ATP-binding protein [Mesomycoplasma flocculare]
MKDKQKFYLEKNSYFFGKITKNIYRVLTPGVEKMLDFKGKVPIVSFQNVDITYGSGNRKNKVIHDISFNIFEGEVLSFVGESGSGKSTTGSAIAGLIPRSFGKIHINGFDLPKKINKIRSKILSKLVSNVQMIFQDPLSSLNPYKNIFAVITEGLINLEQRKKGAIKNLFSQHYYQNTFENLTAILKKQKIAPQIIQQINYNFYKNTSNIQVNDLFNKLINYLEKLSFIDSKIIDFIKKKSIFLQHFLEKPTKEITYKYVIDMLASVGLDSSVLSRFPLEFSGGQQQRIGICRALLLRPKILVADEPISALDVSIQAQIINIFKDLKEKYNLTIFFISHDLRMVEYISDRIAVIYRGRILEIGPTEEITKNFLHPYTKSLIESIPTIESKGESLAGFLYEPKIHEYTEKNQPEWIDLGNNHYILATFSEVKRWKSGDYNYEKN